MINTYTTLLLSHKIRDFNSGFVITKKDVFKKVQLMKQGYGQYCIRFLYDCLKNGYSVKEVGYTFTDREKGTSKTGTTIKEFMLQGWDYGTEVLKIKFRK